MRGGGATFVMVLALICTWGCGEPAPPPSIEGSTGAASSSSGAAESSSGVMAGPPVSLVRAEGWELTDAADDPFPGERPDFVQCEIGWDVETGAFEVSTDLCTYGSFSQRSLAEIHEGDVLELVILHDALYAEEPAVAHLAIAFGQEIAWETEIPIPSEANQLRPTWTAPSDVAINTPVTFHVHNHGTNNYRLIDLTVASP